MRAAGPDAQRAALRTTRAAALASLLAAGCGPPSSDPALVAALDAQLAPHVERGDLSGAVVAGREGRVLYARGFQLADAEQRTPFTPETPVDAGALAQTFTAAAVWSLAQEGRLDLDAPLSRYLTPFPWPELTLRQLLAHSAGLPDREALRPLLRAGETWTDALHVELLRRGGFAPAAPPGSAFACSGVGYDLAARVVEQREGVGWEEFLRQRFFERLGIESAYQRPAALADWTRPRALSYRREAGWLKPDPVADGEAFRGGGDLYLSALDLYRWSASFAEAPVLEEQTLERASRPALISGQASALDQLSWYAAGGGRRHFGGARRGYYSFAYRDDARRFAVVFVSNTAMPDRLRPRLARALVRVMEGGAPAPIALPEVAVLEGDALEGALGEWRLPRLGRVTLSRPGPQLQLELESGLRYAVRPAGADALHVPGLGAWLGFSGAAPGGGFQRLHWASVFELSEGRRAEPATGAGTGGEP